MIQPFHFTKNIGRDFSSFYEKVINCNGVVCFDFEDSIHDDDERKLELLKVNHRFTIVENFKKLSSSILLDRIGFRINGAGTSYYHDDIKELRKLQGVHCIFLPKVESAKQVKNVFKDIPEVGIEIIPIIETKSGFENMEDILSINNSRYLRIAFGHCDFNLSNHYFPFFHHDSEAYWEWIQHLSHHAKLKNKQLINSPVLNLKDAVFFSKVLSKNKFYENISGQITLCLNQTLLCVQSELNSDLNFEFNIKNKSDNFEEAKRIIASFEKFKIADRFFAIDERGRLISPQEYQSAKMILNEIAV